MGLILNPTYYIKLKYIKGDEKMKFTKSNASNEESQVNQDYL